MERKEAIEVVKKNYPHVTESESQFETALRTLIPELKESEDERIWTINYLNNRKLNSSIIEEKESLKRAITWLKKQGEQNTTNKVEPKFEIEKGKWYVCDTPRYTDFVIGKVYYCHNNGMLKPNENEVARYVAKDCFHLWTIQDAKDGDVLYSPCLKLLWIFKSRDTLYCGCNLNYNDEAFCGERYFERPTDAIPATKEQRDQLEKAMVNAGYKWNKEELKLEKI